MGEAINLLVNNEIEKLDLYSRYIDSRMIESLKLNTSLKKLKLNDLRGVEKEAIEIIELLSFKEFLMVLDCNFNTLKSEQLFRIASVMIKLLLSSKSLKKLNLNWGETCVENDKIDSIFKSLKYNTSLKSLQCCFSNSMHSENYAAIAEMLSSNTCLKKLMLSHNYDHYNGIGVKNAIEFANSLKKNNTLEKLLLIDPCFERVEIAIIIESLKYNTSLKKLEIKHNEFGMCQNDSINELLTCNTFLRVLKLESNNITSSDVILIARALEQNTSLQILNLSSNNIASDGAIALFQLLNVNSTLQVLKLSNNAIQSDAVDSIFKTLKTNTSLTELDLSFNYLGGSRSAVVYSSLLKNKTLLKLNLSENNLESEWAINISNALSLNYSLQELNIYRNKIDDSGLIAIAEMLTTNKSLQSLTLCSNNSYRTTSIIEIFKAISTNESLKYFSFISYDISTREILPFLEENYTLTHLDFPYYTPEISNIIERNKKLLDESRYKKTKTALY